MRYLSAEIRWFFKGVPDRSLESWFRQSRTSVSSGERTDYYLLGTGPGLNIKLREGSVEAKQRLWEEEHFRIVRHITGQREGWTKWSFGLQESEDAVQLAKDYDDAWIAVHKRRLMRTFITEMDEITETRAGSYPPSGCNAELTFLEAGGQSWYTIGLESFGPDRQLKGLLHSVGEFFFDEDFPMLISEPSSMGYAAWIEKNFVRE